MIALHPASKIETAWCQQQWIAHHYLHAPIDVRCSVFAYVVCLGDRPIGALGFGRPESTRCYQGGLTYGSVRDVTIGRAQYTRWEILNLARVWLDPVVQAGGEHCTPDLLPGYVDRHGIWRSQLASTVVGIALQQIVLDYLLRFPPCFLDEPYQLREILSYCDTSKHRGVIYQASGFRLVRTNKKSIETYVIPVRSLTNHEDVRVVAAWQTSERSQRYNGQRLQATLDL